MQKGIKSVVRLFITLMLAIISVCFQQARADCTFANPNANPTITFTMPAQIVIDSDAAVGTIVYSGETVGESHGLTCNSDVQVHEGYTVLTDADYSGVLTGVYKTTVPGIGFRAARAENKTATFTDDNMITPWHYLGMTGNWISYDSTYHVGVQLVVIGTVQSGTLDTSQFNADYQMGTLMAAKLRFAPTTINVIANTCNLKSKNINVLLETVSAGGLSKGYSSVLTDDSFKIEVANCTAGTHIDYKFTSAGSTGVTDGTILNIASGEGAASGVGIQILDKDNHVLSFNQEYTGIESATGQGTEEIPLKARYAKTGTVKGGQVDAVATFEVYYR
ncbi:fimbrial protein [Citrobacter werkmanii]|uniref:fimbrial protein n=1 Tax=Citrobacter werkmanii TaxID=67827 RepID=UPI0009A229F4|nr:fimbrial protein [Citrobacter werkmanii]